jgi:hypothetical protein
MVQMLCMTTKQKFEVESPEVVRLVNGRYAYRCECPWTGKDGRTLKAFKFASVKAFEEYSAKAAEAEEEPSTPESPKTEPNSPSTP